MLYCALQCHFTEEERRFTHLELWLTPVLEREVILPFVQGDYLHPWEGDCSETLWWLPKPNRSLRSPSSLGQVFLLQHLKHRSSYTANAPESVLFLGASWAAAAGPEVVGTQSTQDNFCGSASQPREVLEAQEAESVDGSPSWASSSFFGPIQGWWCACPGL